MALSLAKSVLPHRKHINAPGATAKQGLGTSHRPRIEKALTRGFAQLFDSKSVAKTRNSILDVEAPSPV